MFHARTTKPHSGGAPTTVQARSRAHPPTPRAEPARFYVPTDRGGTLEGSRVGVSWLRRHASEWAGEPLVVVPTERHARADAHSRNAIERFRWETGSTYRGARQRGWTGGPVLLLFPDASVLGWFDRHPGVPAICVVQGARYDTTPWARAHQPEDLTTGRTYRGELDLDPVVERALDSLARSRGWRGLTSASDISLTVRSLRLLHANGHPIPSQDLETWALAHGWRPAMAARLADYATRVGEGSTIPLRSLVGPTQGAIARWRRAAQA
jgi:hypothetical protein